jgi:hypothetical protein
VWKSRCMPLNVLQGFGAGAAWVILRTEGIRVNGCEGIYDSTGPASACLPPASL